MSRHVARCADSCGEYRQSNPMTVKEHARRLRRMTIGGCDCATCRSLLAVLDDWEARRGGAHTVLRTEGRRCSGYDMR